MKSNNIYWPEFKFPPVNLWSYPMNYTLKSRYRDMYCSDELGRYIKYHSLVDLAELRAVEREFEGIWDERHEYWEEINK